MEVAESDQVQVIARSAWINQSRRVETEQCQWIGSLRRLGVIPGPTSTLHTLLDLLVPGRILHSPFVKIS